MAHTFSFVDRMDSQSRRVVKTWALAALGVAAACGSAAAQSFVPGDLYLVSQGRPRASGGTESGGDPYPARALHRLAGLAPDPRYLLGRATYDAFRHGS